MLVKYLNSPWLKNHTRLNNHHFIDMFRVGSDCIIPEFVGIRNAFTSINHVSIWKKPRCICAISFQYIPQTQTNGSVCTAPSLQMKNSCDWYAPPDSTIRERFIKHEYYINGLAGGKSNAAPANCFGCDSNRRDAITQVTNLSTCRYDRIQTQGCLQARR